ncbi:PorP/SprF family type IX secretion system membrane protein [Aequorivita marina]|uniref:PorP/SprF family type IX secretion system membrane protein n=1 Tax=Aequorivita marina TaxID=3073654 RepID=UPI0028763395|nr:type IX secretion system membrane protein PorP/SprF [Aequorivita sp. S2608]MDS1297910.1 type IX secretion system membrane protein PorP/SprF [Aequorivita sp. S2608]
MNIKLSKIFVFILLGSMFSVVHQVQAQQNSQFTQYMYNTVSVNPAYAGNRGSLSMLGVYRNQWVGLDGAPETLNFTAHSPVGVQGVGLGLGFTSDKIGPATESIITADFSYTINVTHSTKLSFGIKGGMSLLDVDPNKLLIYDPNDYDLTQNNYSSPVIGAGLFLHTNKWYLGLSSPNLLETDHYDDVQVSTATEKTHVYFTGGYVFTMNPNLKLKPAVMAKAVVGAPLALDVSANALLYERVTFGLAYRFDAAVSGLAGFQVNENIMIGYAYDYDTTPLGRYNDGSHEIFLRFELGTRLKAKVNPRFF